MHEPLEPSIDEPRRRGLPTLMAIWTATQVVLALLTLLHGRFPYGGDITAWGQTEGALAYRYRGVENRYYDALDRNDARAYLWIAAFGYAEVDGRHSNAAFFPGYAWAVRGAHAALRALVPKAWIPEQGKGARLLWYHAGHLVSCLSFLAALCLIYSWTLGRFGPQVAWRTGLLIIAGPTAFVYSCLMSESFFLALSFGALVAAEKKHWAFAALLAAGAAATKAFGLSLVLPLAWIYLRQAGFQWRRLGYQWLWLVLPPLVLLGLLLHFAEFSGDPLYYFEQQRIYFGHANFPDFWGAVEVFDLRGKSGEMFWRDLLQVVMTSAAVVGCLTFARLADGRADRIAHLIFPAIALGATIFAGTVISMPRYVLIIVPAYVGWALLLRGRWVSRVVLAASWSLQAVLWLSWIHNARIVI